MHENHDKTENLEQSLSLDEILADIEIERSQTLSDKHDAAPVKNTNYTEPEPNLPKPADAAESQPSNDAANPAAEEVPKHSSSPSSSATSAAQSSYQSKIIAEVSLDPTEQADTGNREKKNKKSRRGWFGRKKRRIPDPDQDDPYYGLQLKSLEEYRKDYEKTLSFQAITDEDLQKNSGADNGEEGAEFHYLFNQNDPHDPLAESELSKHFAEIRAARKQRIQQAIEETGSLQTDIFALVKDEMNLSEEDVQNSEKRRRKKENKEPVTPSSDQVPPPELLLSAEDFPGSPKKDSQPSDPLKPVPQPDPFTTPAPEPLSQPGEPTQPVAPIPMPTSEPAGDPVLQPITGSGENTSETAQRPSVIESLWDASPVEPSADPLPEKPASQPKTEPDFTETVAPSAPQTPTIPTQPTAPTEPTPSVIPQPADTVPPITDTTRDAEEEKPSQIKEPTPAVQPNPVPTPSGSPAPRTEPRVPGAAKPPLQLEQKDEDLFPLYRAKNVRVHIIDADILTAALEREAKQYPKPSHFSEKKVVPIATPVQTDIPARLSPSLVQLLTEDESSPEQPGSATRVKPAAPQGASVRTVHKQTAEKPSSSVPTSKPEANKQSEQTPAKLHAVSPSVSDSVQKMAAVADELKEEVINPVSVNLSAEKAESGKKLTKSKKSTPKKPSNPVSDSPDFEDENTAPSKGNKESKRKRDRFHVLSDEEKDNRAEEELPPPQEELDDYCEPADAPSIMHSLGAWRRELTLRTLISVLCTLILGVIGFLGEFSFFSPDAQPVIPIQTYLILNIIFLFILIVFNLQTIISGIKGLLSLRANSDSGIAVAALIAEIQAVILAFSPSQITSASLHLYVLLAAFALLLNTIGKLIQVRRVARNFRFVASPESKTAIRIFDDHNTSLRMGRDCVPGIPVIAYQRKTRFLSHFMHLSFDFDPSDQHSQIIAPLGVLASLILCIASFLLSGDALAALTALTVSSCICVPFTNTLCVNLPLRALDKLSARCGTMLCGYPAVEKFSKVNAVLLDARDLFPKGTLVLNGIKTFGGQRIDEAIMDATGLMCAVGGPLSDLFSQIVQNRHEILPKVENPVYEDGMGVVGWVSGRRILVGNRLLLQTYSIEPPTADYEETYRMGGRQIIYLAADGELVAMFLISYVSDRRRAAELHRMEDNGLSLIVRTCDPTITPAFLASCFQLDESSIAVLPDSLGKIYTNLTEEPDDSTDALLATKGRPTAMLRMLTACVRQRSNISIALLLQAISVVLGFLLVAFLTCYSGLSRLTTLFLVLYEILWSIAILLLPRLRKP